MSIQSQITRIQSNIANAYTELEGKGATMPETQNSANLAAAAASVEAGGGGGGGEVETCIVTFRVGSLSGNHTVQFTQYNNSLSRNTLSFSIDQGITLTQVPKNTIVCVDIAVGRSGTGSAEMYYAEDLDVFFPSSLPVGAFIVDKNLDLYFYNPKD